MTDVQDVLPNKLSALIRVGINDLIKAETARNVMINMYVFHNIGRAINIMTKKFRDTHGYADDDSICCVCLAGTVMINTLGGSIDHYENTDKWGLEVQSKLYALDEIRRGHIQAAMSQLNIPNDHKIYELFPIEEYKSWLCHGGFGVRVPEYHKEPEAFKARLLDIADRLESVGY